MGKKQSKTQRPAKPVHRTSSGVPGTIRGFSVQANRFLAYLLTCGTDSVVSLEAFDDVGVETPEGRLAEQSKSIVSRNPLADRSPHLWKTLANWTRAASDGTLPPKSTKFKLFCHAPASGRVASLLVSATDDKAAVSVLKQIRSHLGYPNSLTESEELRRHMLTFLEADTAILFPLLGNLTIVTGSLLGNAELLEAFGTQLIGPDTLEDTIRWAHGWVKERCDEQIALNQPCFIRPKDFHECLLNYVQHHDRLNILKSIAGNPEPHEVDRERTMRTYVRQLEAIELDDVEVLEAINDYLRASIDRTHWAARGHTTREQFDSFASELTRTWRTKRRKNKAIHSELEDVKFGQLLCCECMEHRACLDGLETPEHFVRGSWHALADSAEVGWHPQFRELFATESDSKRGQL